MVRVIGAFPWKAEDFRSPTGTYRIRLTLEDPTARIHAFVYAEDGVSTLIVERSTKIECPKSSFGF